MQKTQEISLRDHGDLRELFPVDSHNLAKLFVRLLHFSPECSSIRKCQFYSCCRFHKTISTLFLSHIFRRPTNRIYFSTIRKRQLHIRLICRRGILAAHHLSIPLSTAGFPIQRKCNSIKNRRLSGACIAVDQKQSMIRFRKVNHCLFSIRSERTHCKLQWFHSLSPPAAFIISLITDSCFSFIGTPRICS